MASYIHIQLQIKNDSEWKIWNMAALFCLLLIGNLLHSISSFYSFFFSDIRELIFRIAIYHSFQELNNFGRKSIWNMHKNENINIVRQGRCEIIVSHLICANGGHV